MVEVQVVPEESSEDILCWGAYNIRWLIKKGTTAMDHRKSPLIISVPAHLFLITETAGPFCQWTTFPLAFAKESAKEVLWTMPSVTASACTVLMSSAILVLLWIWYTCDLGTGCSYAKSVLIVMSFGGQISVLIRKPLDKACPEQNTDLVQFHILSYYLYMFAVHLLKDIIYFKLSRIRLIMWLICYTF